jgi:hypothetical protein
VDCTFNQTDIEVGSYLAHPSAACDYAQTTSVSNGKSSLGFQKATVGFLKARLGLAKVRLEVAKPPAEA